MSKPMTAEEFADGLANAIYESGDDVSVPMAMLNAGLRELWAVAEAAREDEESWIRYANPNHDRSACAVCRALAALDRKLEAADG